MKFTFHSNFPVEQRKSDELSWADISLLSWQEINLLSWFDICNKMVKFLASYISNFSKKIEYSSIFKNKVEYDSKFGGGD